VNVVGGGACSAALGVTILETILKHLEPCLVCTVPSLERSGTVGAPCPMVETMFSLYHAVIGT
jgi:hypothetical protein